MMNKDKLKKLSAAANEAYKISLSATRATYDAKEVARSIFDNAETITHEPSKDYTAAAYDAACDAYDAARTAQGAAYNASYAAYDVYDAAKNLNN